MPKRQLGKKNRNSRAFKRRKSMSPLRKLLVFLVIVAVGTGCAYYAFVMSTEKKEAQAEAERRTTIGIDKTVITIPGPKWSFRDPMLPDAPWPFVRTRASYSLHVPKKGGGYMFHVTDFPELEDMDFSPEDFRHWKEAVLSPPESEIKERLGRDPGGWHEEPIAPMFEGTRIQENGDDLLIAYSSGTARGYGAPNSRTAEFYLVVKGKLLRIAVSTFGPSVTDMQDPLPLGREWVEEIRGENN